MAIVRADEPMTLREVQLRLGVPQHVLIHLCEKGVIEADLAESSGRGKRREFSNRNLFEFAVALALRRFELSVATIALMVRVLRSFTRAVTKAEPAFTMPDVLLQEGVELALQLYDGEHLVLVAGGRLFRKRLLLGAKIAEGAPRVSRLEELPAAYDARLDVNLAEIARRTLKSGLLR